MPLEEVRGPALCLYRLLALGRGLGPKEFSEGQVTELLSNASLPSSESVVTESSLRGLIP